MTYCDDLRVIKSEDGVNVSVFENQSEILVIVGSVSECGRCCLEINKEYKVVSAKNILGKNVLDNIIAENNVVTVDVNSKITAIVLQK